MWVAHPVGMGVLLGTLAAFTLFPLYRRLHNRWGRPTLAALVCVGWALLGFASVLALFSYVLIGRGIGLAGKLAATLQPGGTARLFLEQINNRLPYLGLHSNTLGEHVSNIAARLSAPLAQAASLVAGTTLSSVLGLFFVLITTFFVLKNWSSITLRAEIMLPLKPRDTRALLEEFRRLGRTVLLGTVVTGMAQGLLAGLGYYLTRIPEAAFFGALTAASSLVPGVGTLHVWLPLGVYLVATGHVTLGIIELVYGVLIVTVFTDYVLRPRLVGGHGEIPSLLTFVAVFGGIERFGLIGMILGPVIMGLAVALLRIYEKEATLRRADDLSQKERPTKRASD